MFVIGCILYECLTGSYPFEGGFAVKSTKMNSSENIKTSTIGKIICMLLQPEDKRPSPEVLLKMMETCSTNNISQAHGGEEDDEEDEDINPVQQQQDQNNSSTIRNEASGFFSDIKSVFRKYTTET